MLVTVTAESAFYRVVSDIAAQQVALAYLRVLDEDGATPINVTGRSATDDARIRASAKNDGFLALVGDPKVVLADPMLPPAFTLTLSEPGFQPASRAVALPANPTLPVALPDLVLRRLPRTLAGRVVTAATGAPVAGAVIALAPTPAVPGQHLVLLRQPLRGGVPAGSAVQGFPLAPVPVPATAVSQTVPAGATWLEVNDRTGLAAGQVLQIGPPERLSLARIGFVSAVPAPLTVPGLVLLATPLTATARKDDPVLPFTLGPPGGAAVQTIGAAFAGEALLVTDAASAGAALIVGPAATGIPFSRPAASDADGYYRFDGIARIPRFNLTVTAAGIAPQTRAWMPAAGTASIDWRLKP